MSVLSLSRTSIVIGWFLVTCPVISAWLNLKWHWLFTIYHKVSEISVRMQMVRLFWWSQTENFQNFRNVLKGSPTFPTGISERKMCLPFGIFISSKPYSNFDACHVSFSRGCANGSRQSWSKIFIGDFRLPFVETVDQPVFPCKW